MSQVTYFGLLVDASGSMGIHREQVISSVNEFIESQQGKEIEGETYFSFYQFSCRGKFNALIEKASINDVTVASVSDYQTGGLTSLYTSIRTMVERIQEQIENDGHNYEDVGVVLAVITDGYNNDSAPGDFEWVKEAIPQMEEDFEWDYVYIGIGGQEHDVQSRSLNFENFKVSNMSQEAAAKGGIGQTMNTLSESVTRYRSGKSHSRVSLDK